MRVNKLIKDELQKNKSVEIFVFSDSGMLNYNNYKN